MTTPPQHRMIQLPGGPELHVIEWMPPEPNERALLLVHGLASNALLWGGVGAALADRGFRAIAVDQRGHGRSEKPETGYDMATVVADLRALVDTLGLDRPVIAGQSWGGNVVIEFAATYPGIAAGIVPVDGGAIELQQRFATWEECRTALAPPKFAGTPAVDFERFARASHPDWPESGIAGTLGNVEVRADGTVAPWLTFDRHIEVLRGLWEHRPSEQFARITDPVLWMPADTGSAPWTHEKRRDIEAAVRSLANSRVEWFSPADHDLHAQFPEAVADLLVEAITTGWMK